MERRYGAVPGTFFGVFQFMASANQDDPQSAQTEPYLNSPSLLGGLNTNGASPDSECGATTLQPGERLGKYEIIEKIGEGGMGLVFKATDTELDRTVALKVMFTDGYNDRRQAQRFEREARAMARLSHPNLLHVYSVGSERGCHYFAMELLRGETLLSAVRRLHRIPAPDLMQYTIQIVSALFYVHQKGILHRDIKGGNIMLCGRRAVLMDFGLAKDEADSGLTSVGAIMGTPDYMPPEAAEGRASGPPTDLYSLGVVLYEALSGQLPFTGKSAIAIIRQHIETPPPDLEQLVPEIKPELAAIVHKCLEKKPEDRFADCPALARALWDIVPDQIVLDVAEGRVPGADEIPLEQIHFGTSPNPNATSVPRTAGPRLRTGANATIAVSGRPTETMSARSRSTISPTETQVPRVSDGLGEGDETEVDFQSSQSRKSMPQWVWAVAGFIGVVVVGIFVLILNQPKPVPKVKEYAGQPVARKGASINKNELLMEFRGGDADPAKWYFIVRRQKPDGSWGEDLKIPYSDYVFPKTDTEVIFTSDDAQRKP